MHSKTPYIVGFIRDAQRRPIGPQRSRMEDRGIRKIYTDLALLIKQRIEGAGDVVAVDLLMLLAEPTDARKLGGKSASLMRVMAALERKGVSIWELDTDLRSTKSAERDKMIAAALASFQRRRYESTKRGRKQSPFSQMQDAIAKPIWFNVMKPDSNKAAADEIAKAFKAAGCPRKKLSVAVLLKRLGPSGRSRVKSKPKRR